MAQHNPNAEATTAIFSAAMGGLALMTLCCSLVNPQWQLVYIAVGALWLLITFWGGWLCGFLWNRP